MNEATITIIEQGTNALIRALSAQLNIKEAAVIEHIELMLGDLQPGDAGVISFLDGCACAPGASENTEVISACACQI